ncbi:MAG: hypothetical protein WCS94_22085 [Verrucomicrobiota bacterium]
MAKLLKGKRAFVDTQVFWEARLCQRSTAARIDLLKSTSAPWSFPGRPGDLEHFHQIYSDAPMFPRNSGLLGFWLCFSSVAGFSNLRLR